MNNPEATTPWGKFIAKGRMDDVFWYDRSGHKRTIERFVLPSGIHYALILDHKTGKQIFDDDGFHDSDTQVNLGDGHVLKMFITHKGKGLWSSEKDTCTSFVEKKVTQPLENGAANHELTYDVDPIRRTFRMGYFHQTPREYTKIVLRPCIEPNWGTGHSVFVSNHFQAQFDQNGRLEQVWLRNKGRVINAGVTSSGVSFALTEEPRELYLSGNELYDVRVHQILENIFGISYGDLLILDVDKSVNRLLSNIDGNTLKNPRFLLSFNNASPVSHPSDN